jgi:Uncharacterised BCR, YnfA/UPF0060 family
MKLSLKDRHLFGAGAAACAVCCAAPLLMLSPVEVEIVDVGSHLPTSRSRPGWGFWQGVREHRGIAWTGAGIIALGRYGFVATLQADPTFGWILAAYGGVFVAGSLA